MKKRKMLTLLMALSLILSVFAGCGNNSTISAEYTSNAASQSDSAEPSAETPTPMPLSGEPEELSALEPTNAVESIEHPIVNERVTYTLFTGVDPRVVDLVNLDDLSSEYKGYAAIADATNITFDITAIAAMAYSEQFQLMIAGGDYCDAIYDVQGNYATNVNGALKDEVVMDLYSLLEEYAPNFWNNYLMKYNDLKVQAINAEGQIGSLPLLLAEPGQENNGNAIRKDWLDEMGMDAPNSMEQLEDYLYAANERYGAYIDLTEDCNFGPLTTAMGFTVGGFYRDNDKVTYGWASDKAYEYLTKLHQWYMDGIVSPDFMSVEMHTIQNGFANGEYSITSVNGASDLSTLYSYTDDEGAAFCGVGALPMQTGGAIEYASANTIVKNLSEWSISTQCADPVPLIKLIDYLFTDEGRILNSWGTEGLSYELDENGDPQWTDLIVNNPDGYSYVVARTVFAGAGIPGILDMSRDYYAFSDLEWEAYNTFLGVDEDINNLPAAAENCLTADELTKAAALYTDIDTYVAEMIGKWIVGTQDLTEDAFSEYVKTIEGIGLAEYTEYYQTAYDRYLEKIS